ncbi:MAG: hypothetical protein WBM44_19950 [Waterburya sp.]
MKTAQTIVFTTQQILSLDIIQGNQEWKSSKIDQLKGAYWEVRSDGTFVYAPANARDDLYPLHGTWHNQNNSLVFSAKNISEIGTSPYPQERSFAKAIVDGKIDFIEKQPVLTMESCSSMTSRAVVNRQSFDSTVTSVYRTTISLRQVK